MTITVHRLRVMAQAARLGRPASLSADELMEMASVFEGLADKNVSLMAQVKELTARNAELVSRYDSAVGVGDGSGDLFVYGKYDAVKKVQSLILAHAALLSRAEAAEAEIKRRDALSPVAYRWDSYTGQRFASYRPNHPERNVTPLFTAAPAPVVPPEWSFDDGFKFAEKYEFAEPAVMALHAWNACRAAMLSGEKK